MFKQLIKIQLVFILFMIIGCSHNNNRETILTKKINLSVIQYKQKFFLFSEKKQKRDNILSKESVYLVNNESDIFGLNYSKETDDLIDYIDSIKLNLLKIEGIVDPMSSKEMTDSVLQKFFNHEKSTFFMLKGKENKYSGSSLSSKIEDFILKFSNTSKNDSLLPKHFYESITFENIYSEDGGSYSWELSFDHLPIIEYLRILEDIKEKLIDLNIQVLSIRKLIK